MYTSLSNFYISPCLLQIFVLIRLMMKFLYSETLQVNFEVYSSEVFYPCYYIYTGPKRIKEHVT